METDINNQQNTTVNYSDSGNMDTNTAKSCEDMVLVLSQRSLITQIPLSEKFFRTTNKRRSKTSFDIELNQGDAPRCMISCHSSDDILFFTDKGMVYRKKAYELMLNKDSQNKWHLINSIVPNINQDECVVHMMRMQKEEYADESLYLVFVTQNGMVKRTQVGNFKRIIETGKLATKMMAKDGIEDKLKFVLKTQEDKELVLVSSAAKLTSARGNKSYCNRVVRCPVSSFRIQGRVSAGRKGIGLDLKGGQNILSASTTYEGDKLVTIDSVGRGKFTEISKFTLFKRGGSRGMNVFASGSEIRKCVACILCDLKDEILMTTNEGKIYKCKVSELGTQDNQTGEIVGLGRTAQGVRLLNKDLEEKVSIIYYTKLPHGAITDEGSAESNDYSSEEA